MTTTPAIPQPGLVHRILGSPPVRVLLLWFVLVLFMSMNTV
jgi:hypothetical protein